ncbi:CDP-diacylglycerol--glycerol-3-phosphate 3-phosphatidyltransferase [Streptomyces sp. NPDC001443]
MTGVPAAAAGGPARARTVNEPSGKGAASAVGSAAGRDSAAGREAAAGRAPGAGRGPAAGRESGAVRDSVAARGSGGDRESDARREPGAGGQGEHEGVRSARREKLTAAAVNQASVWNIANLLTMLRLILVPGFVALMLADGGYDPAWRSLAWAAFAIAMITDLFDGHLARTYNLVTDFGKIADPIADKAIMGAALICLSWLGDLPWWVTGVILGRELAVTLIRFLVIRYGVIPASRGGKLKTLAQGIAVGMYVLALTGWLATARFWVMAVAVVLTVVTGLDYVRQAIVLRRQGIAERKAAAEEAGA